jgi:hypothetical protein
MQTEDGYEQIAFLLKTPKPNPRTRSRMPVLAAPCGRNGLRL